MDSIASVTTVCLPTPTGPLISHWPVSSSAYPSQRRQARKAMAPKMVSNTKSGTLVPAAAGAWLLSRPSHPAASRGCGLSDRSGSTVHDHHIPVAIPQHHSHPTSLSHRQRPTFRRQPPSAPPAADQTWSTKYHITAPVPSRAAKTSARLVAQPSSCPEPANQIKQRRQIPHRPALASVRTLPAVSSLEAFRTPASVHLLAPGSGRHLKTLNDCRPSRRHAGTGRVRPLAVVQHSPFRSLAGEEVTTSEHTTHGCAIVEDYRE